MENFINLEVIGSFQSDLNSFKGTKILTKFKKIDCPDNDSILVKGIENLTNLKTLICF